jgi:serine/threonine protein kinase
LKGYKAEELVGKKLSDLIPEGQISELLPLDRPSKRARIDVLQQSFGRPIRVDVIHKDSTLQPFDVSCVSITGGSNVLRMVRAVDLKAASGVGIVGASYILKERIDSALHGNVYTAVHKDSGELVAIKMQDKKQMNAEFIAKAKNEYEIGRSLIHENIVKYLDLIETSEHLCIVMEYCTGGNLYNYTITRPGKRLSEEEARLFFRNLVDAVSYCHSKNCMHGDIKLNNALLHNGVCKLMDFNMSKASSFSEERTTFCGTPMYIAPELVLQRKYGGKAADIWSLGVCLYLMVTGQFPFDAIGVALLGNYPMPPHVSPDCANLIQGMLKVDPDERLSISVTPCTTTPPFT